jgi:sialate O-acetylesterase
MELQLAGWTKVDHSNEEIKAANYPQIRQFEVPKTISITLKDDLSDGVWKICDPSTAGDFSAAAYFFARALYNQLKVPIGIINSTMGGTQIESWISHNAFEKNSEFKNIADSINRFSIFAIKKFREESVMKKVAAICGASFTVSEISNWKNIDYNDSKWLIMKEPAEWGEQGFRDFGGIVWIRKTINLDEADTGKVAILELSKIADGDETFVNGIKVGSNHNWNDFRKYSIPAGVLHRGKNVIAIRIFDDGGSSGLYGDEDDLKLTIRNKIISLAGDWLLNIESVSKSPSIVFFNGIRITTCIPNGTFSL